MVLSIRDIHTAFGRKYSDLLSIYERILDDVQRYPSIFISQVPREEVLAEVKKAREIYDADNCVPEDKPLLGIPWVVKDNIDVAGMPTTAGCPDYAYVPGESAEVCRLVKEAGAILLGKTNLDQFATGLVGIRSPYGIPANPHNPDYIPGGSSSGSAVAVARGLCCFSLGTDTAGSGRVPASMNGIFGLKPTRGLLSTRGVVPACRSLDCVSLFASRPEDLSVVLNVLAKPDSLDPFSRSSELCDSPVLPKRSALPTRIAAVPKPEQLNFMGSGEAERIWHRLLTHLIGQGFDIREIDFGPFLEAAGLLYDGPWIAERYAFLGEFVQTHKASMHEVTATILENGGQFSASDCFKAQWRLQEYRKRIESFICEFPLFITPTIPRAVTVDEVLNDPIGKNTELGYYTNFMNLLDLCAVAVPFGAYENGCPWGFTVFSDKYNDQSLLEVVNRLPGSESGYMPVAVCGAHMSDLPLNHQLTDLGGVFSSEEYTAARYRMYALTGAGEKPGLVRCSKGFSFPLEVWNMPNTSLSRFLQMIPAPLGLGEVELRNGKLVTGFICGMENPGEEISSYGGWRAYLENRANRTKTEIS